MKIDKVHGGLLFEAFIIIKHAFPYFTKHLVQKEIVKKTKSLL